jgi:hypothetical protein
MSPLPLPQDTPPFCGETRDMRKGEKQNMTNLKLGNLNHTLNMLFGSQKLTTYANKSYLLDSPH